MKTTATGEWAPAQPLRHYLRAVWSSDPGRAGTGWPAWPETPWISLVVSGRGSGQPPIGRCRLRFSA